jgi:group I intron endonuclease
LFCLRNKKHRNNYLQRAFEKHGEENFIFEVLEKDILQENLLSREQFYLDLFKSHERDVGYNLNPVAGSNLGFKMPESAKEKLRQRNLGKKHSEETKKKISSVQIGKKRKSISKLKTSLKCRWENNPSAKLNFKKVREIRIKKLEGCSAKKLSKEYEVSESLIYSICANKVWKEGDYYVPN